jgi:uncharacterized protein involved in exopolysaccharide biosynthesis
VGAAGSASASPAEGEAVRRLEARLKALEELVRAGPSKLALEQTNQKVDSLSAQVERRLAGVKKGMGALHERLTAVELAMAKLPEQRFQSAREFFEALRTVQAELCPSELDELTVAIDGHVLAEDLDAERATLVPLAARQGGGGRQTEPDAGRTDPLVDPLGAAGALYDDETVSIG